MVPRVDGDYLPDHPANLVRDGRYNKVDVISGVCRDEGAFFGLGKWGGGGGGERGGVETEGEERRGGEGSKCWEEGKRIGG